MSDEHEIGDPRSELAAALTNEAGEHGFTGLAVLWASSIEPECERGENGLLLVEVKESNNDEE